VSSCFRLRRPPRESVDPVDGRSPLARIWALDVIVAAYVAATAAVVISAGHRIPAAGVIAGAHLGGFAVYALLRRLAIRSPRWRVAFFVSLFLLVLGIFEGMGAILPHLRADVVADRGPDAALASLDRKLFGSDPTTWFTPVLNPLTVFLLQFCYTAYFFLPVILTVLVLRRRRLRSFLSYAAIIIGAFFTTYVGYYLVPAYGPRFYYTYDTPIPLGPVAGAIHQAIDSLDYIRLNAFPSGHTSLTVVFLAILFYEDRRLAWRLSPLVAGLIVATVALRYHYLVDVVAGLFCAALWVPWGMRAVFRFDHWRRAAREPAPPPAEA